MNPNNILGLDIGSRRIGLARVNMQVKLPQPLNVLDNDKSFLSQLKEAIKEYEIDTIVVGLPRNLNGEETEQSKYVREFVKQNIEQLNLPVVFQDETLSTYEADQRLRQNGQEFVKNDAVAAVVILEDYLKGLSL